MSVYDIPPVQQQAIRREFERVWDASHLPPLNCAGCRKCCLGDTIKLQPWEDPSRWKTKLVDGRRVLRKGKDGNCVYLGKQGCRIQGGKPHACRWYDCRVAAQLGVNPDRPATLRGVQLLNAGASA